MNRSTRIYLLSMAVFGSLAPFVRNIAVSSGELALYRAILGGARILGFTLWSILPIRPVGNVQIAQIMVAF